MNGGTSNGGGDAAGTPRQAGTDAGGGRPRFRLDRPGTDTQQDNDERGNTDATQGTPRFKFQGSNTNTDTNTDRASSDDGTRSRDGRFSFFGRGVADADGGSATRQNAESSRFQFSRNQQQQHAGAPSGENGDRFSRPSEGQPDSSPPNSASDRFVGPNLGPPNAGQPANTGDGGRFALNGGDEDASATSGSVNPESRFVGGSEQPVGGNAQTGGRPSAGNDLGDRFSVSGGRGTSSGSVDPDVSAASSDPNSGQNANNARGRFALSGGGAEPATSGNGDRFVSGDTPPSSSEPQQDADDSGGFNPRRRFQIGGVSTQQEPSSQDEPNQNQNTRFSRGSAQTSSNSQAQSEQQTSNDRFSINRNIPEQAAQPLPSENAQSSRFTRN